MAENSASPASPAPRVSSASSAAPVAPVLEAAAEVRMPEESLVSAEAIRQFVAGRRNHPVFLNKQAHLTLLLDWADELTERTAAP